MTKEERERAKQALLGLARCAVSGLVYAVTYRIASSALPGSEGTIMAAMLGVFAADLDSRGVAYEGGGRGGKHLRAEGADRPDVGAVGEGVAARYRERARGIS